jgi:hypothetical protein
MRVAMCPSGMATVAPFCYLAVSLLGPRVKHRDVSHTPDNGCPNLKRPRMQPAAPCVDCGGEATLLACRFSFDLQASDCARGHRRAREQCVHPPPRMPAGDVPLSADGAFREGPVALR